MVTISVCMIVKNEEAVLARCLESLKGLWEELIIVDTGSTDGTKEIAGQYTKDVYDFSWTGNFSDARNFAFSKAHCEYIYSADADEELDEENRQKFFLLKEALLPEVEIVQMYYGNQLSQHSVYNFDKEYRPKLYKRVRQFVWEEPIHEAVRLQPLVYDSDITIWHKPHGQHGARDLAVFEKMLEDKQPFSKRMQDFYLRELYFMGELHNLEKGHEYLVSLSKECDPDSDTFQKAIAILCKEARLKKSMVDVMKYALKGVATKGSSELCLELGHVYFERQDYEEASIWYYNAAYETKCLMDLKSSTDFPLERLEMCHALLENPCRITGQNPADA